MNDVKKMSHPSVLSFISCHFSSRKSLFATGSLCLKVKKFLLMGFSTPCHIFYHKPVYIHKLRTENAKRCNSPQHNHNVSIHLVTLVDLIRSTYVMFLMHYIWCCSYYAMLYTCTNYTCPDSTSSWLVPRILEPRSSEYQVRLVVHP